MCPARTDLPFGHASRVVNLLLLHHPHLPQESFEQRAQTTKAGTKRCEKLSPEAATTGTCASRGGKMHLPAWWFHQRSENTFVAQGGQVTLETEGDTHGTPTARTARDCLKQATRTQPPPSQKHIIDQSLFAFPRRQARLLADRPELW